MLRDADALLIKARAVIPDAAGLVLCDDRAHARATGALLRTIAGEKPVVVVSDEPQAHARIDRFARGDGHAPRWLVAVNMVSEGVESRAWSSPPTRRSSAPTCSSARPSARRAPPPERPDDLVATVFMPADPTLTGCAERVEVELRQQVIDDVGARFDVEPPPGLARRRDFQALDAQVEPGGMIVAGVHYAASRSTPPGDCCVSSDSPSARCARCSSSCGASASAAPPPRSDARCPRIGASSTSAARSTASRGAGRSCGARSIPLHVAAGAGARQPRDGRTRRADAGEAAARRRPRLPARELAKLAATIRSRPSDCGFRPASRRSTDASALTNDG